MLTPRQNLILLFIYTDFARNQYFLIKHLDRIDVPCELSKNLKPLFDANFIKVSGLDRNGNEFEYSITEKGIEHLKYNFNDNEVTNYVKSKTDHDFYHDILKALIEKKNSL